MQNILEATILIYVMIVNTDHSIHIVVIHCISISSVYKNHKTEEKKKPANAHITGFCEL